MSKLSIPSITKKKTTIEPQEFMNNTNGSECRNNEQTNPCQLTAFLKIQLLAEPDLIASQYIVLQ
jgi:hypothetical protein